MRRGLVVVVACVACGAGAVPVGVALPPPGPAAAVRARAPACSIHGDGELVEVNGHAAPFPLFASSRATNPGLVIEDSPNVAATWSELPPMNVPARAAIALGGQKLLRVHAYASLAGRGFQLRTRGYALRDHLWIDWGYTVELLGTDDGMLVVRRPTGFKSPQFVEARVECDLVAWERNAFLEPWGAEEDGDLVEPSGDSIALYTSPSSEPFMEIVPGERGLGLRLRERRDRWVHVRVRLRGLGIDGWAHERDVKARGRESIDLGNIRTIGRDGAAPKKMRVRHESPVLVGKTREPFADATFEEGALLDSWSAEAGFLLVTFENRAIHGVDGMWIAETAAEAR